jgi:hypothetical protein
MILLILGVGLSYRVVGKSNVVALLTGASFSKNKNVFSVAVCAQGRKCGLVDSDSGDLTLIVCSLECPANDCPFLIGGSTIKIAGVTLGFKRCSF